MVSMYDVLKASKGVPVNDMLAELWGRKLSSDYTIATYTGTLPAVLTGTKAGNLHRYKIYGNVGENQFDKNTAIEGYYFGRNGNLIATTGGVGWFISWYISVDIGTYVASGLSSGGRDTYCCIYDENKRFIRSQLIVANTNVNFSITAGEKFVRLSVRDLDHEIDTAMFTKGSTPPESYIPHEECGERTENGYKLTLLSDSTPVDIYIGDDTISTEEYIDSGTGKIYRMVSGVLTPTDPPVPFPQIPTSANSTTISWAGEGLAPSEVELEYERK